MEVPSQVPLPQSAKPHLLFLVHRIPFPPNKGDKVRSYHLLKFLAQHYQVHLGTFVDYADDWQYVPALDEFCASVCAERISPRLARVLSLRGLLGGEALSLPFYRNRRMANWVRDTVGAHRIERAVVFSSPMAQYIDGGIAGHCVVDFVDVDSAKWTRYAEDRSGLMAWLYRREGLRLAAFEREVAQRVAASVLVSEAEAALFKSVAPEAVSRTHAIGNGVNADSFSPQHDFTSPYATGERPVVFTGAMDYWPNIDAVCYFADEVWPAVLARYPDARFHIVGMNPSEAVRALAARPGINVTGTVPDVRPWLRHAHAVVAPLRVARGVQNKILEAMAMGRPVVASATCAVGISARQGEELFVADATPEWVEAVSSLLADTARAEQAGQLARQRVLSDYSWEAHLQQFRQLIEGERKPLVGSVGAASVGQGHMNERSNDC
ncbi:TIGR03087 family PEP-CTERM/XrtA system glycosyltransferase [Uliginosibacterium sp. H3]|uniref:TIGR03087 family PEP-CTERM/XrtA system glycosyltransferase n=1 Tax=Uliginosibacterium silvisoli TaxID=3114758 RepID=A0ABU6K6E4_9RHOO|nr:TIGR03087 family PEP-CTERM/XrtA system glycosyltransferase [Uliginosibacterium sp. H3]